MVDASKVPVQMKRLLVVYFFVKKVIKFDCGECNFSPAYLQINAVSTCYKKVLGLPT